ncbi:hypothetical protein GQR58_029799 [Nymphon striatum]|nr:hypothetical protein GQR58_029799 [Nymphon striatum]
MASDPSDVRDRCHAANRRDGDADDKQRKDGVEAQRCCPLLRRRIVGAFDPTEDGTYQSDEQSSNNPSSDCIATNRIGIALDPTPRPMPPNEHAMRDRSAGWMFCRFGVCDRGPELSGAHRTLEGSEFMSCRRPAPPPSLRPSNAHDETTVLPIRCSPLPTGRGGKKGIAEISKNPEIYSSAQGITVRDYRFGRRRVLQLR